MMSSSPNNLVRNTLSAELRRRIADHMREHDQESSLSTVESFEENKNFMQSSASSEDTYTLGDESSVMNRNRLSPIRPFDRPAVQGGRNFSPYRLPSATLTEEYGLTVPAVQRSTMCRSSSIDRHSAWYILAMILPMISIQGSSSWRTARQPNIFSNTFDNLKDHSQSANLNLAAFGSVVPSVVANTVGPCFACLVRMYDYAADQIRAIAQDQVVRDIFATAMDIVLVIYAIGFLILSVYQATM